MSNCRQMRKKHQRHHTARQPNKGKIHDTDIRLLKAKFLKRRRHRQYRYADDVDQQTDADDVPNQQDIFSQHPFLKTKISHKRSRQTRKNVEVAAFKGHDFRHLFVHEKPKQSQLHRKPDRVQIGQPFWVETVNKCPAFGSCK